MEYRMYQMITVTSLLLLVLAIQSIAAEDQQNASSLFCYQCNSAEGMEGQSCSSSSKDALAPFYKACPVDGKDYTRCRKMDQTVEGESRVIRSCATIGAGDFSGERCVDRVGTNRVKVQYCECNNQSPTTPCNSAHQQRISSAPVMAFLVLLSSALLSRL